LEKVRQPQKALQQYRRALEINPSFGIARFRSAKVLLSMQRFDAALDELKQLQDMAPDESNVHFMLGRVYKQLGNKSEALRHYTIAMNLDPKVSSSLLRYHLLSWSLTAHRLPRPSRKQCKHLMMITTKSSVTNQMNRKHA